METETSASDKDDSFDLEATIAAFLCDEGRTSIELPSSLSAEQRKLARRLADQHPELKCQSYGIGAERQLHLFKKVVGRNCAPTSIGVIGQDRPADQSANAVRVKNTFIDDWEGEKKAEEPLICRSTPAGSSLVEQTVQRCKMEGKYELSPVVESVPKNASIPRMEEPVGSSSPVASSSGHEPGQFGSSPPSEAGSRGQELPSLPEGVKVSMRNTFIHIESVSDVERNTQSMPHGMFRQQLASELANQHELPSTGGVDVVPESPRERYETLEGPLLEGPLLQPTGPLLSGPLLCTTPLPAAAPSAPLTAAPNWPPPPLPSEGILQQIALGTEVVIQGLVKLPDFNGLGGVVQSFDYDTGRYNIHLNVAAGSNGHKWVKVKADNLLVQVPPPPLNAPTIAREGTSTLSASAPEFRPSASVVATPVVATTPTPVVSQQQSVADESSPAQSEKECASESTTDQGVKPLALNALV